MLRLEPSDVLRGLVPAARLLSVAMLASTAGCAGGAPLLHPAHVLPEGEVSVAGGLSGTFLLDPRGASETSGTPGAPDAEPALGASDHADFEHLTAASGIAPWVGGRVGLGGSNEAGLTYTGRTVRLDGRHAFDLGGPALSVGLGASAIMARRPGGDAPDGSSVYGGGLDIPVLLGFRSSGDVYALWLGPRVGFSLLRGSLSRGSGTDPNQTPELIDVSARHLQLGFVLGLRAGFRHLHVAVEVGGAYHRADGELNGAALSLDQVALAPGGGLIITF
ncbi:hypothetical protein [Chondromyces crocatus]|uniref:Outer membrane protein beta-barrel domain-containing protein n=1 Tax=Chondromyces crocatus TaxID=52 RepID=A0A0K1E5P3_CHOCO|nr:hypothetical protein [Chondromyces crocatus]AKT36159.1 uncharacterized protein CMC5_002730 [Chondromyces crocatus]